MNNKQMKGHPITNYKDAESIGFVIYILSKHRRVMPELRYNDKWPNYDGYLEVSDQRQQPIGIFIAQVRRLPDVHNYKARVEISFLKFCKEIPLPVFLLGVDHQNKNIYWLYIDKELINSFEISETQQTITIDLNPSQIISETVTTYIKRWEEIIKIYAADVKETRLNRTILQRIYEHANPAFGLRNDEFREIHVFLDKINDCYENIFPIIKEKIFQNSWKIGFAYSDYKEKSVVYSLFPIPYELNDVQIKILDEKLIEQLTEIGYLRRGHLQDNPIKEVQNDYIIEIIQEQIQTVFSKRLLNHVSEFIMKEYLFAFIDNFNHQLNIEKKNNYTIDEIEYGLNTYLPYWIIESIKFLITIDYTRGLDRIPYLDPDLILTRIPPETRERIKTEVRKRIERKETIPIIPINTSNFSFRIVHELLTTLKKKNIRLIERIYIPKDSSRIKGKWANSWDLYSPESIKNNLETFFSNLQNVYNEIIKENFSIIADNIPLFKNTTRLIIVYEISDRPTYEYYYLFNKEEKPLKIEIYSKEDSPEVIKKIKFGTTDSIILEKKQYDVNVSKGLLEFIFGDIPMTDYIYNLLSDNIREYLNKKKIGDRANFDFKI